MGCDTAKWKGMDPQVRHAYHQLKSPSFQLTYYDLSILRS